MSLFRSFTFTAKRTLEVPGAPGQRVSIRKLTSPALRAALLAKVQRATEFIRRHGAETFAREVERHGGEAAVRAQGEADPAIKYEFAKLIAHGVISWDPPRTAPPEEGSELQGWLARAIVEFADPRPPGAHRGTSGSAASEGRL